jgi:hypothetical protein
LTRPVDIRFGKSDKSFHAAIEAIGDLDRIEIMTDRFPTAKSRRELIDQSRSDRIERAAGESGCRSRNNEADTVREGEPHDSGIC